jgi:norsolorinic acid ketoreductase
MIVKIDASVPTDASDAVASLRQQGLTSIDVVFANAGIYEGVHSVLHTPLEDTTHHFNVNVLGPLSLLQATADILKASQTGAPTFIATSSELGSIALADVMLKTNEAASPYGATKAMLNWFIKRVAIEEPWLSSYAIHPGLVETDLTSTIEDLEDLNPISVDTSVDGILDTFRRFDAKDLKGTFRNYDGSILPW